MGNNRIGRNKSLFGLCAFGVLLLAVFLGLLSFSQTVLAKTFDHCPAPADELLETVKKLPPPAFPIIKGPFNIKATLPDEVGPYFGDHIVPLALFITSVSSTGVPPSPIGDKPMENFIIISIGDDVYDPIFSDEKNYVFAMALVPGYDSYGEEFLKKARIFADEINNRPMPAIIKVRQFVNFLDSGPGTRTLSFYLENDPDLPESPEGITSYLMSVFFKSISSASLHDVSHASILSKSDHYRDMAMDYMGRTGCYTVFDMTFFSYHYNKG